MWNCFHKMLCHPCGCLPFSFDDWLIRFVMMTSIHTLRIKLFVFTDTEDKECNNNNEQYGNCYDRNNAQTHKGHWWLFGWMGCSIFVFYSTPPPHTAGGPTYPALEQDIREDVSDIRGWVSHGVWYCVLSCLTGRGQTAGLAGREMLLSL